jgi:hypothetical protein
VNTRELRLYIAECRDTATGNHARFQIKALTPENADMQARDGYFGLLAPPSDERRAELEVKLTDCGEVRG